MSDQELIQWIRLGERLPDDDSTVLFFAPEMDEPVWLGWCDSGRWYCIDASPIEQGLVIAWAEVPGGPNKGD